LEEGGGMPELDGPDLQRLGALYVEQLSRLAPNSSRIIDKNPDNGRLLGLIHLMLPRAKIIAVRRHPLDTCLSCFTHRFPGSKSGASYDRGEPGRRSRRYSGIMEHWQRVLPAGAILHLRYEDLVANIEHEARRLLEYCGLPWDERCLQFHEANRAVRTASAI